MGFRNSRLRAAAGSYLDISFWLMALIALATRSLYQAPVWPEALVYALGHAVLYRALYWLVACRFSPWKTALLWLGSPLLLFSMTWLRPGWAVLCTVCWSAALWWSIRQQPREDGASPASLAGYLIVLLWVSLCGTGGYGFQSWDYQLHNGRLLDLIHLPWPVHYVRSDGSSHLLVQYAGYYLWPALAGKLAGEQVAMLVQHLWLLAGCWLALRMMVILTSARYSWYSAVGLVLFGGWSFIGLLLFVIGSAPYETLIQINLQSFFADLKEMADKPGMPVWLSFWPATQVSSGVWFGSFISLASSMLWAPNQVVAGWLVVGLLCRACREQKVMACLFACSLLAYWSPMIALGLFPVVLVLVVWQLASGCWCKSDVLPMLAAVWVLCVLGVYYASVPIGDQPYGVLLPARIRLLPFALFVLQSWGFYAMLVLLHRRWLDRGMKRFACAIFVAAAVVSFFYYGVNNDLMVRSSAALFYGILLIMIVIMHALWRAGERWRAAVLAALLLVSVPEGVLEVWQAATHADMRIPGESIVDYAEGWQFLGRKDSWFVRYMSADIQTAE